MLDRSNNCVKIELSDDMIHQNINARIWEHSRTLRKIEIILVFLMTT